MKFILHNNQYLRKVVNIPVSFCNLICAYLTLTSLQTCKTDNGLVFPLVQKEFHFPSIVNPVMLLIQRCTCTQSFLSATFIVLFTILQITLLASLRTLESDRLLYGIHCMRRAYGFLFLSSLLIIKTKICVAALR